MRLCWVVLFRRLFPSPPPTHASLLCLLIFSRVPLVPVDDCSRTTFDCAFSEKCSYELKEKIITQKVLDCFVKLFKHSKVSKVHIASQSLINSKGIKIKQSIIIEVFILLLYDHLFALLFEHTYVTKQNYFFNDCQLNFLLRFLKFIIICVILISF